MIERGKFRSLTLINWNGFFAALLTWMNWSRRYPGATAPENPRRWRRSSRR